MVSISLPNPPTNCDCWEMFELGHWSGNTSLMLMDMQWKVVDRVETVLCWVEVTAVLDI